jgi:hypothetical protein
MERARTLMMRPGRLAKRNRTAAEREGAAGGPRQRQWVSSEAARRTTKAPETTKTTSISGNSKERNQAKTTSDTLFLINLWSVKRCKGERFFLSNVPHPAALLAKNCMACNGTIAEYRG